MIVTMEDIRRRRRNPEEFHYGTLEEDPNDLPDRRSPILLPDRNKFPTIEEPIIADQENIDRGVWDFSRDGTS